MTSYSPRYAALVLAAGKGTRMHSQKPKVLRTLLGEPMLAYALAAIGKLFDDNIFIVAGFNAHLVREAFPGHNFIIQEEQLGTGHALQTAMPKLRESGAEYVLVVNGDTPLVQPEDLEAFMKGAAENDISFASITLPEAGAYGRVARDNGLVSAIVEAKDFDPAIHGPDTGEVNAGIYLLRMDAISILLGQLDNNNKSGEYYITDLVGLGIASGLKVGAINCGENADLMGVNSPAELARMEDLLAARVAEDLLGKGVTAHCPALLRASPFAMIEPGVEIYCPCEIYGHTIIRAGAVIESHCVIKNSQIGENVLVRSFSHLEDALLEDDAQVGPYTRLRPGAKLENGAHAGNFVELKKAVLGKNAKANHLSYLGDAIIGACANIGAGTITCNYDGKNKFQTIIGEHAFIGSNSALVAPVDIGPNTLVGAGSVITKNVPAGELAIARGRQKNLPLRKKDS